MHSTMRFNLLPYDLGLLWSVDVLVHIRVQPILLLTTDRFQAATCNRGYMSVFSMVADRMQAVVWLGRSASGGSTARMIQVSKFVYIA